MKTNILLLLLLLFTVLLASCASTATDISDVYIEKKQSQKRLLFTDWKYKGFGQDLPVWFEPAYNNDIELLRDVIPQLKNCQIKIVSAEGINIDQAKRILQLKEQEISSDFEYYDSFWALYRKEKIETYIAIGLFYCKENN